MTTPTPWASALTLAERAYLARMDSFPVPETDEGRRRLRKWRTLSPFSSDEVFQRRLDQCGLNGEEMLRLLSGAGLTGGEASIKTWACAVEDSLREPGQAPAMADKPLGLLTLASGIIEDAVKKLCEGARSIAARHELIPFDPDTVDSLLLMNLLTRLSRIVTRTLVLELNVARLEGRLTGDTPEGRFRNFVELLRNPEVRAALLREYPVMARLAVECASLWLTNSLEFLERLAADWAALTSFEPALKGLKLTSAQGGAGDTHRRGRSVMILTFGLSQRLVYKPRSLSGESHYRQLLEWLNERSGEPKLVHPRLLAREHYGWIEFVSARTCKTQKEVETFYRRLGALLAVLYGLHATDFHFENIIASGEFPVLVDLETLFHPSITPGSSTPVRELAARGMGDSVLSVGLLPQKLWGSKEREGIDISGFGGEAGQMTPPMLALESIGTDEMRYTLKAVKLNGTNNRPALEDRPVQGDHYAEPFLQGFETMYRVLLNCRDELLAPNGPIAAFAEDEVRVVVRPTSYYGQLLTDSYHPNALRDALDRDRLLDNLWNGTERNPLLQALTAVEHDDLVHGDVPLFTVRAGSQTLCSSSGVSLGVKVPRSGMACSLATLAGMSEADLHRQRWLIRGAIAAANSKQTPVGNGRTARPTTPGFLESANEIACVLDTLSYQRDGLRSWIALNPHGESWSYSPAGVDLYSGVSGISLFYAYLAELSGKAKWMESAKQCLRAGLMMAEEASQMGVNQRYRTVGPFSSDSGLLHAAVHLSRLSGDESFAVRAGSLVQELVPWIAKDEHHDIISGSAGFLSVLLATYRAMGWDWALKAAVQCGDHLLLKAQAQPTAGCAWSAAAVATASGPLGGFSHGVSGIGYALLQLFQATGRAPYRTAAGQAFEYERTLFTPSDENWKDLRQTAQSNEQRGILAWCHGAPGIGLSRIFALEVAPENAELERELEVALRTTQERGFGGSHCLCHGDFGNLDLMLEASLRPVLSATRWRAVAERVARAAVDGARKHGWRSSGPAGVELPGLMMGLAGIGYGLLRVADPVRVPSVLMLQGPR